MKHITQCVWRKNTHTHTAICVWTNNTISRVPDSQKATAADKAGDKQSEIVSCVREAGGLPASASLRLHPCVCMPAGSHPRALNAARQQSPPPSLRC